MNEPTVGSKRAHSPRVAPAKRAKASQACLSCRKHKTRCEMLDGDNSGAQCHRCKVLSLPCSFEDSSGPPPGPSSARGHQAEIASQSTIDRRSSASLPKKPQDVLVDDMRSSSKIWGDPPSNSLSQFRALPGDADDGELLHPERLLPEKHSPWGFLKLGGFESNMVPMLAIQALTRSGINSSESPRTRVDQALLHLLGRDQVKCLVDTFEERYTPWLNLQPSSRNDGPFLRLAQCCVASRHLDPSTRSIVTPQLYRLADDFVFKQCFNPLPSTDAIYAVLVLSMWEPVGDSPSREARDGRLIAATAVSMAMNLHLSEAMVYARKLCSEKKSNEPPSAELSEALDKARLWFCLTAAESMLCVGTGREPISDCQNLIYEIFDTSSQVTLSAARDLRLTLLSQLFATTRQGLSIRLQSASELGDFHKQVLDFLIHMDVLERIITPLPVLADHEVSYFRILQIYYQSCRALFLVHALMETKIALTKTDDQKQNSWFLHAEHNGVNLTQIWGHQALVFSEAALVTTISIPDPALLSTAPDSLFSMVTFATIYVMVSKWNVFEHIGLQMPGSSDSILAKTVERLSLVACSRDHYAAKCARLIEAGIASFKKKIEKSTLEEKEYSKPVVQHFAAGTREFGSVNASRNASGSSGMDTSAYASGSSCTSATGANVGPSPMDPLHVFPNVSMNDSNYFMGPDIFLDNDFWSTFVFTATDGNGMNMTHGFF